MKSQGASGQWTCATGTPDEHGVTHAEELPYFYEGSYAAVCLPAEVVAFTICVERLGLSETGGERGETTDRTFALEALSLGDDGIRDMCGLLEDHGVKLLTAAVASEGFFGLSVGEGDGGPAVFVNVWDRISVERWIFTAAHELAHLLLHPAAYDVTESGEAETEEAEADAFAGYFLMPNKLFDKEWAEARGLGFVERVFKVKRMFRVSWQTVLYRVAIDRPKPERKKIWAQFHAAYERQHGQPLTRYSEPAPADPTAFGGRPTERVADEPSRCTDDDFHEDRLSRLVRDAVERQKISLGRAAEILRLDLVEMRSLANAWVG